MRGDFNLLDIGEIYMGARNNAYQQARSQWEMDRANRMDAQQQAMQEQERTAAAEERKLRFEMLKSQQKREAGGGLEGEKIAANLQRAMAVAPTPEARASLEQRAYEMQQRGMIPRVEVTGPQTTPEQAAGIGSQAEAIDPRAAQDMPLDAIAKQVILGQHIQLNDPRFPAAYEFARREAYQQDLAAKRAGASQVNIGGKDLPASSVAELGDVDFLRQGIGDLGSAFDAAVPAGGVVDQGKSRASAYIPNSDVANYNLQADMFAQKLGTTLEGGKLTDTDYQSKYRNMVPRPGDSAETKQKKLANIDALLAGYGSARESAYGRSGYRTPRPKPETTPRPRPTTPPKVGAEHITPAVVEQLRSDAAKGDAQAVAALKRLGIE